jgi:hypothetical protein
MLYWVMKVVKKLLACIDGFDLCKLFQTSTVVDVLKFHVVS